MKINDLMKQAQQMQEQMQKAQEEMAGKEVQGESGAGMVKITMNGRHDVKQVNIDSSLMSEDKEVLEDLLAAAVNDAVRKVEAGNKDALSGLAGGLDLSSIKMPF
jgi:DNA-binding YbaB/EbfC family protein